MNRYLRAASCSATLALSTMGALAQTATPPAPANPPATLGTTPQEAAEATQKAVPRSDTATVVRTAPSPVQRASDAMGGNSATAPASSSAAGTADMNSTPGNAAIRSTRAARADRN